jgi:hypothetical protein
MLFKKSYLIKQAKKALKSGMFTKAGKPGHRSIQKLR